MPPKRSTPSGRTTKTNDNNKRTNNNNNNFHKTSNNLKQQQQQQQQRYDTKSFKAEMKKFDTFKKTNTDFASLDYYQVVNKNRNSQEECSELDENSTLNANNILCYITTLDTIGMNPYKDDSMDITVDPWTPSEVPTGNFWEDVMDDGEDDDLLFLESMMTTIDTTKEGCKEATVKELICSVYQKILCEKVESIEKLDNRYKSMLVDSLTDELTPPEAITKTIFALRNAIISTIYSCVISYMKSISMSIMDTTIVDHLVQFVVEDKSLSITSMVVTNSCDDDDDDDNEGKGDPQQRRRGRRSLSPPVSFQPPISVTTKDGKKSLYSPSPSQGQQTSKTDDSRKQSTLPLLCVLTGSDLSSSERYFLIQFDVSDKTRPIYEVLPGQERIDLCVRDDLGCLISCLRDLMVMPSTIVRALKSTEKTSCFVDRLNIVHKEAKNHIPDYATIRNLISSEVLRFTTEEPIYKTLFSECLTIVSNAEKIYNFVHDIGR